MQVAVIIPAAGRSERFGAEDKLGQDLGGRPLLLRTVELFARRDEVRQIIVAGPPDDFDQFRDRYGPTLGFHGASCVPGGRAARWESVRAALDHVSDDMTHIAVHDAARPCTSDAVLDRVFSAARLVPAVIAASSATSTIKTAETAEATMRDPNEEVSVDHILGDDGRQDVVTRRLTGTLDRGSIMIAQTPQVFTADTLRAAYAPDDHGDATDDAAIVAASGLGVVAVEGDPRNIKVTTRDDLALARLILKAHSSLGASSVPGF